MKVRILYSLLLIPVLLAQVHELVKYPVFRKFDQLYFTQGSSLLHSLITQLSIRNFWVLLMRLSTFDLCYRDADL